MVSKTAVGRYQVIRRLSADCMPGRHEQAAFENHPGCPYPLGRPGFAVIIWAAGNVLGIVWCLPDEFSGLRALATRAGEPAVTPALLISILTLVLGNLIQGILPLVAYIKAKHAQTMMPVVQPRVGEGRGEIHMSPIDGTNSFSALSAFRQ